MPGIATGAEAGRSRWQRPHHAVGEIGRQSRWHYRRRLRARRCRSVRVMARALEAAHDGAVGLGDSRLCGRACGSGKTLAFRYSAHALTGAVGQSGKCWRSRARRGIGYSGHESALARYAENRASDLGDCRVGCGVVPCRRVAILPCGDFASQTADGRARCAISARDFGFQLETLERAFGDRLILRRFARWRRLALRVSTRCRLRGQLFAFPLSGRRAGNQVFRHAGQARAAGIA